MPSTSVRLTVPIAEHYTKATFLKTLPDTVADTRKPMTARNDNMTIRGIFPSPDSGTTGAWFAR